MRNEIRRAVIVAAFAALHGLASGHAFAQESAGGFSMRHEAVIEAPRADVYRTLVQQVGAWWDPQHTYSGDAGNLSIDARPGGCFCESFPNGGGVEHLRVVYVVPDEAIRMSGGLGPLQSYGVAGSLTWSLSDTGEHTTVTLTYVIGGYIEGGFERVGPAVSGVVEQQLRRLKQFVETGEPTPDGN